MVAKFKFEPCPSCCKECPYCPDGPDCPNEANCGTLPDQMEVVLDGITDDGCGSCSDLNGTYVLDFSHISFSAKYVYNFPSPVCGVDSIWVNVRVIYYCKLALQVSLQHDDINDPASIYFYKLQDPAEHDCDGYGEEDIPYETKTGTAIQCDGTNATCVVTSIVL